MTKKIIYILCMTLLLTSCGQIKRKTLSYFGRQEAAEVVKAETKKALQKSMRAQIKKKALSKVLSRKGLSEIELKELRRVAALKPSGNGGINKEGRTIAEIAIAPLTEELQASTRSYCKSNHILKNVEDRIIRDFSKSRQVASPSIDRHVDLGPMAITLGKFPDLETLISDLGGMEILKKMSHKELVEAIRNYHYEIAWEAFARKYNITKSQAKDLIGKMDHVIHESEDGFIQIVPNNVHRFLQEYKHNGLVSKRVTEISGVVFDE